jgi:hypothetical protein
MEILQKRLNWAIEIIVVTNADLIPTKSRHSHYFPLLPNRKGNFWQRPQQLHTFSAGQIDPTVSGSSHGPSDRFLDRLRLDFLISLLPIGSTLRTIRKLIRKLRSYRRQG